MDKAERAERKAVSEMIAENLIVPIVTALDMAMCIRPDLIKEMRDRLTDMRDRESVLAAFPTPETMHKAEDLQADNDLFQAVLNLVEKRAAQQEFKHKQVEATPGDAILRQMGF